MRIYNPTKLNFGTERIFEMCVDNFNAISASIKSIVAQVRGNRDNLASLTITVSNGTVEAWATVDRPVTTPNAVTIGINTTTNKLNLTYDGGTTWYNADGSAA